MYASSRTRRNQTAGTVSAVKREPITQQHEHKHARNTDAKVTKEKDHFGLHTWQDQFSSISRPRSPDTKHKNKKRAITKLLVAEFGRSAFVSALLS